MAKVTAADKARKERAKAKVTELVDANVQFNPKSASGHLMERAIDNLTLAGKGVGSTAGDVAARSSGAVRAGRPGVKPLDK